MDIPIYPIVHVQVDDDAPCAFETNTVRLTLTTYLPVELIDSDLIAGDVVVGELLGKAAELASGRKES